MRQNNGARGVISKQESTGVYKHFSTSRLGFGVGLRVRVSDRVKVRVGAATLGPSAAPKIKF